MKIRWSDRIGDERVLEAVGEPRKRIGIIKNGKRKWAAHTASDIAI